MDDRTKTDPTKGWPEAEPGQTPFERPPRPRWGRRLGVLAVLLLLAGVALWVYLRPPPAAPRNPRSGVPPVATAPVQTGNINVTTNALGTVTSLATVTVRTQISGQIVRVAFQEGQIVNKGDFLAEIDPRPYQVALAQAEGAARRDQALLKNAAARPRALPERSRRTNAIAAAAARHPGRAGAQDQGTVQADQAQIDTAKLNLDLLPHRRAGRAAASGCARSIRATTCTAGDANGIVVITQLQPITRDLHRCPRTICRAILQAAARRRDAAGHRLRPQPAPTSSRPAR